MKESGKNKKGVYLDTTIISYLVGTRKEMKTFTEITNDWWKTQRRFFNTFVSPEVLAEVETGNYSRKEQAMKVALKIELLERNQEIIDIAKIYISQYLMPKDLQGDAMHLAYSSYYKLDFLLTWNCKHLANANKKAHIRNINTKLNLYTPEIITPMELFI